MNDFIQLTEENLEEEHICCIIRSRSKHPGIQSKKEWLSVNEMTTSFNLLLKIVQVFSKKVI